MDGCGWGADNPRLLCFLGSIVERLESEDSDEDGEYPDLLVREARIADCGLSHRMWI